MGGGPKKIRQRKEDSGLTAGPMDLDGFIWLDECVRAVLAHAVLSAERHSVSDGEGFTEEEINNRQTERERVRKQTHNERLQCLQSSCVFTSHPSVHRVITNGCWQKHDWVTDRP